MFVCVCVCVCVVVCGGAQGLSLCSKRVGTMRLLELLVLVFCVAGVQGILDPCSPGVYSELKEKERSTGYRNQYPAKPMCDITLQPGWYRFTSHAGGMMPESCPPTLHCGTVVPVWLSGAHPSVAEGAVTREVCANFHTGAASGQRPCCEHSASIGVKNCTGYYVYYLLPTPSCPIAYCAGDKAPCPLGQWSPTGFPPCKEAFPKIESDPTLTGPEVVGRSFHFSCHINYTRHDPDLAFDVLWTFDGKPDANIPAQTLRDPARVATLDGALLKGHMGTNVGCQIRARYMTHVNMSSPWLKSPTYWAGIRTEQTHLTVSEKEETKNVTLVSTIPILCDHTSVCCLTMKVDVDGPKENLVSAHACEYEMCSTDWDSARKEARIDVPVTASKDQIKDGDMDLMLAFENILSSGGGPYLGSFDGFRPQNVPVDVQDGETKSCYWIGDPHIHGMNHRGTFHLFKVGDYTMIQNPNRHMEVQARTWPCVSGRVTCICGVTIREKDDVIRISQCDQPYSGHHTSPTVQVASDLREGTVVRRSTDGQHFVVYLPSGMEVMVDANPVALNAYITVPSTDAGEAKGICGTFDHVAGNEFTRRDGGTERECDNCVPQRFTESWKNTPQTSLFENLPPRTHEDYVPKYCSCDKDVRGEPRINCTVRGDIPRHTLKCAHCTDIQGPLPSFMDLTQGWNRRSADLYVDVDEKDPAFDVQRFKDFQPPSVSWPTPSGISRTSAENQCQKVLQGSQLWGSCQKLTDLYDRNYIDCVTDILYGDTYEMVELAAAAYLAECQATLSRDPHSYVSDARGKSVLKPELSDVCSVFCFRHGTCVRGKCHCHPGYAGDNCQLIAGKGPQLARVRSNNTCDINKRPCRKVFVDATNIEEKESLACRVQVLEEDGKVSSENYTKEAEFLSAGRLACFLPDTNGRAMTQLRISATNDGQLYGNALALTVFDSTCLSCDQNGTCAQLAFTCNINNTCHQDGDVNPDDDTLACNSKVNTSDWTARPTVQPSGNFPHITPPTVTGPDDDFQMACAVTTSATETSTRFQVTWYVDDQPRETSTVTKEQLPDYLNLLDPSVPKIGQLSCKVRSFFAGQTDFSPLLTSTNTMSLADARVG